MRKQLRCGCLDVDVAKRPPPLISCAPFSNGHLLLSLARQSAVGVQLVLFRCCLAVCLPFCRMLACVQLAPSVPCMGSLLMLGACSCNEAGVCFAWLMLSSDADVVK
jgi:hypothetical protein